MVVEPSLKPTTLKVLMNDDGYVKTVLKKVLTVGTASPLMRARLHTSNSVQTTQWWEPCVCIYPYHIALVHKIFYIVLYLLRRLSEPRVCKYPYHMGIVHKSFYIVLYLLRRLSFPLYLFEFLSSLLICFITKTNDKPLSNSFRA
ncbi:hypothetical protein GYH30_039833 [Glycine max]|uniref:Uncharacterized protein n=2 Tax=Glycine subgen. Soja TaxID=1462606 RepID=A0A0R0GCL3_SOYBN|nr:hypothetical protein GYH30_039833 [Glycine max]RZB68769.1 hypothetical protein D0Y65_038513 [Glycine soja]